MGFIDCPFADMAVVCVHSRLGRRPDFGPGLPIPDSFRSCRSSRLQRFPPQRVDPRTHPSTACRFVAPCSRPWGSPRFKLPGTPFGFPRPEGRGPEGPMESSPVAKTLRSVSLPGSRRPNRHRASSFRIRLRSPVWRAPSSFVVRPLPCCHGALRAQSTSRLCSTEESVAMAQRFRCAPLDAPMGFDIDAFRCCRAFPRRPDELDVSPLRASSRGVPGPERHGEGKVFRLCLAPRVPCSAPTRRWAPAGPGSSAVRRLPRFPVPPDRIPEGRERNRSRRAPAHPEGSASAASRKTPKGPKDADGSTPKGGSTPSARGTRRRSVPTQSRPVPRRELVAIQRTAPKGCAGGSSSCSPALRGHPRTSGEPARRRLPTPEGVVIRAPLAPTSRRTLRRTFPWTPEGITVEGRVVRSPEGDPLTARGSVQPQQAGVPVSGQTDIVSIEPCSAGAESVFVLGRAEAWLRAPARFDPAG